MGNTASDIGTAVGNAFLAPIKAIFGHSCENICSGIWDVECFIEHLCVPDLFRLLLVCALCYVCLVFLYLLFKLGLCQCVVKTLCKMCWATCETYCFTLDYICCFCWHKIRYTKRVYRTRHRNHHERFSSSRNSDVEVGGCFTNSAFSSNASHTRSLPYNRASGRDVDDGEEECGRSRKRKSRHGEGDQRRRRRGNGSKKMRVKTRRTVSFQVKGRSRPGRSNRRAVKHSQRLSFGRSAKRSNRSVKLKKPKTS